jgi:hypothetical protein
MLFTSDFKNTFYLNCALDKYSNGYRQENCSSKLYSSITTVVAIVMATQTIVIGISLDFVMGN